MYHTLEQLLLKNETRMDGGDLVKNVCDEFMRPNLNLERLFLVIQNDTMGTLHQSIGLSLKNLMHY